MRFPTRLTGAADRLLGMIAMGVALVIAAPANAQNDQNQWKEANKTVEAIGGWKAYARERAQPPEGYPSVPAEDEVLLPEEVLAADVSIDSAAQLSAWEARRYAERSASLEPPTLSYARMSGDAESSTEVGIHLPVGAWIRRSRSLAADDDAWGTADRRILELQATRNRLVAYADAVTAKAEMARAVDRLEVQRLLEELTQRQRDIGAVPEFELLALEIERTDAEAAEAAAREAARRAAEQLALDMRRPLSDTPELQRRLPLELTSPETLPDAGGGNRLDVQVALDSLAQQQTTVSRSRSGLWLGGLELGVLQERTDTGDMTNTVELSWRLPFGGEASRQVEVGERSVQERTLQLRNVQQVAEREQLEADRAKALAAKRLAQATEALNSAELWMEEQVYRYSGMLIGPHDILRAAARLRQVQSVYIASRRGAFVATVNAHYVRSIPTQAMMTQPASMSAPAADAGH